MDDIKALIDAAKEEGEASPLSEQELFIKEMGIEPSQNGEHIPNPIVYWNYLLWKEKRNEKKLLSRSQLFIGWKKKFKQRGRCPHYREYYIVASSNFRMPTREEFYQILADIRREREWRATKRKREQLRKERLLKKET